MNDIQNLIIVWTASQKRNSSCTLLLFRETISSPAAIRSSLSTQIALLTLHAIAAVVSRSTSLTNCNAYHINVSSQRPCSSQNANHFNLHRAYGVQFVRYWLCSPTPLPPALNTYGKLRSHSQKLTHIIIKMAEFALAIQSIALVV